MREDKDYFDCMTTDELDQLKNVYTCLYMQFYIYCVVLTNTFSCKHLLEFK